MVEAGFSGLPLLPTLASAGPLFRGKRRQHKAGWSQASWALLLAGIVAAGWAVLFLFEAHVHSAGHDDGLFGQRAAASGGAGRDSQHCAALLRGAGVPPSDPDLEAQEGDPPPDKLTLDTQQRHRLYAAMQASLTAQGLQLDEGNMQGMGVADLFREEGGALVAVLQALETPVRAVVLPFADRAVSKLLSDSVARHLLTVTAPAGVWVQNSSLFHATMYHASTHLEPVPASGAEVEAEAEALLAVGAAACPVRAVLERVVATPGGTVIACWQVAAGGGDPAALRRSLAAALPLASTSQIISDGAILHTTLARLTKPPRVLGQHAEHAAPLAAGRELAAAAERMTAELCGIEARLPSLWFVEEQDKLALALGGRFRPRAIPLECRKPGGGRGGGGAAGGER